MAQEDGGGGGGNGGGGKLRKAASPYEVNLAVGGECRISSVGVVGGVQLVAGDEGCAGDGEDDRTAARGPEVEPLCT